MRTACERCSGTPATLVSSRKNLGLLFTHKTFVQQLVLCRACATRLLTTDLAFTCTLGWWSVFSILYVNATCIMKDISEFSKVRKMATPDQAVSGDEGTP
jgi:hypothetical protein